MLLLLVVVFCFAIARTEGSHDDETTVYDVLLAVALLVLGATFLHFGLSVWRVVQIEYPVAQLRLKARLRVLQAVVVAVVAARLECGRAMDALPLPASMRAVSTG